MEGGRIDYALHAEQLCSSLEQAPIDELQHIAKHFGVSTMGTKGELCKEISKRLHIPLTRKRPVVEEEEVLIEEIVELPARQELATLVHHAVEYEKKRQRLPVAEETAVEEVVFPLAQQPEIPLPGGRNVIQYLPLPILAATLAMLPVSDVAHIALTHKPYAEVARNHLQMRLKDFTDKHPEYLDKNPREIIDSVLDQPWNKEVAADLAYAVEASMWSNAIAKRLARAYGTLTTEMSGVQQPSVGLAAHIARDFSDRAKFSTVLDETVTVLAALSEFYNIRDLYCSPTRAFGPFVNNIFQWAQAHQTIAGQPNNIYLLAKEAEIQC